MFHYQNTTHNNSNGQYSSWVQNSASELPKASDFFENLPPPPSYEPQLNIWGNQIQPTTDAEATNNFQSRNTVNRDSANQDSTNNNQSDKPCFRNPRNVLFGIILAGGIGIGLYFGINAAISEFKGPDIIVNNVDNRTTMCIDFDAEIEFQCTSFCKITIENGCVDGKYENSLCSWPAS